MKPAIPVNANNEHAVVTFNRMRRDGLAAAWSVIIGYLRRDKTKGDYDYGFTPLSSGKHVSKYSIYN